MLIQAYRRSHAPEDARGGISQESLLELMGRADSRYLNKYDRSTVSRWESGDILPDAQRIRAFGTAFDRSRAEVDGLLSLAGLDVYATDGPTAEIQDAPGQSDISDIEETLPASYAVRKWERGLVRMETRTIEKGQYGCSDARTGWTLQTAQLYPLAVATKTPVNHHDNQDQQAA